MPKYILAHDLGTSGNKATLFDENGRMAVSEVFTYKTCYSAGNCVEQNPHDWWAAVKNATKALSEKINPSDIAAVSFSGQMQGCTCVDRNGEPLYNSFIWADQRATKESDRLLSNMPLKEFYYISGHRMNSSQSIAKLMWIKNNLPDVFKKTYKALNAKDYIIFKLTGKFVTDFTDASGTAGLDLMKHEWSREIFNAAELDIGMMPDIYNSTDIAGYVTKAAANECGLVEGTPVVCGGGDGVASGIGAGCININDTYCCMGTSAWVAATHSSPVRDEKMAAFTFPHMISRDLYMPCGGMSACGPSLDWFVDNFANEEKSMARALGVKIYDLLNLKVAQSPAGAKGLLFLPYIMGERSPRWNPLAKGTFVGITVGHNKDDMLRAVLEGVAFNLSVILDLYKKESPVGKVTIIGGCADDTWSQICADVFDVKLNRINHGREATSIGAAVTAGVGVGMFSDFSAVNKFIKCTKTHLPDKNNARQYEKMKPIFDEAYYSLVNVFNRLSELQ